MTACTFQKRNLLADSPETWRILLPNLQVHYCQFIPEKEEIVEANEQAFREPNTEKIFQQSFHPIIRSTQGLLWSNFGAITFGQKSTIARLHFCILTTESRNPFVSKRQFPLKRKKITTEYRCTNLLVSDKELWPRLGCWSNGIRR